MIMSSTKSQVAVATTNIPSLNAAAAAVTATTTTTAPLTATTSTAAVTTTTTAIASAAKDYNNSEEQQQQQSQALGRQNSFGNNRRANMKGKHLTRSHAMRESTSPPRTPTPRGDQHGSAGPAAANGQTNYQQQQQQQQQQQHVVVAAAVVDANEHNNSNNNNNNNNNKLHVQSTTVNSNGNGNNTNNNNNGNTNNNNNNGNNNRGSSPLIEAPIVIVTSQHKQQQQQQHQNVAPLSNEAEFPKLTPPKKTSIAGQPQQNSNNSSSSSSNNKIEYNNNNSSSGNNNNSNGKKYDIKPNGNIVLETHKHGGGSGGGGGGNNNKHHQQQQHYVTDRSPSSTPPTTIYNSGMNYQLNTDRQERHDQQQQQQQQQHHHQQRNESQNSNDTDIAEQQQQHQQQQHHYERGGGGGGGGGGKKHRANTNSKSTKPRLKNLGGSSSGSNDGSGGGCGNTVPNLGNGSGTSSSMLSSSGGGGGGNSSNNSSNNTSGFISRENSGEQYTDHGGTDLLSFFKETLNRNPKDRNLLMKIEKDLTDFVQEKSRGDLRFPAASSYNRMLIHRTAAYFGMEHNVDSETQQCVIVAVTKNTRIPEMRFKSLVRDQREDARKSILKRDTHSFDEPRQSPYLNPDRGMLDRKSKSFEEREENYERARSRIFSRGHADNSVGDGCIGEESYGSWSNSAEQQQRQARATGKFLKMQNSVESRDGRSSGGGGAVPKAHSFGGYGGPPSVGGPSLPRGDSTTSNKSSAGRSGFTKQDSTGSTNTAWRLSPTSSGSIYHFDPSNLPPNQALASGVYQQQQQQQQQASTPQQTQQQSQSVSNNNNSTSNYVPYRKGGGGGIPPTNQAHQQQQQQQQQQQLYANEAGVMSSSSTESYSDEVSNAQEGNTNAAYEYVSPAQAGAGDGINYVQTEQVTNETTLSQCPSLAGDECDNAATACLSITTTSTKNYDRIEVQKFKHQATSPNIPCDKEELPDSVQDVNHIAANNEGATTEHAQSSTPVAQVPPQQQQNCETSLSPSSTPYSSSEVSTKQVPEEPKTQTWTYTQTYQAADGSTMFHTAAAPNGAPYCTTYQQAPDGSIYAVPQGMIYAYPQPAESEVQGYLMPVFDPNQQRNDAAAAAAGMIPAGAQAIYQAPGGTATVMPVATAAYPAAQFATAANGAPIYQAAPVIYSSEQFAQAATGPGGGQLQQIPTMTTYPIGYPYPYNGYWGQTMTYYVPAQQAVAAAPLVSAAQAAAPPQAAQSVQQQPTHQPAQSTATLIPTGFAAGTQPPQVAGGMQLTSITPTAAGPQSGAGSNNNGNNGYHNNAGGTTYYGSGRVKRTPGGGSIHYNGATFHPTAGGAVNPHQHHHAAAGHLPQHHATAQLITATIPGTGVGGGATTTTYHAVPTITLAAGPAHNAAGAPNTDLSAAPNGSAPMYALQAPHGAALLPTNVFPYAAAAAPGQALPPPPLPASNTTATVAAVVASAQSQQQNAVITAAPFYPASANTAGLMEAPATNANPYVSHGGSIVSNSVSQSAPSTPHSLNTQPGGGLANTRQPPIFSTPPIANAASGGGGGIGGNGNGSGGYHSNSSTPHYYTSSNHNSNESPQSTYISNSFDKRNNNGGPGRKPHNTYNMSRQNSTSSGYNGGTGGIKTPLLNSNNEPTPRASPSGTNNGAGGYHPQHRTHPLNKRNGDKPQQAPLIGGPPPQPNAVYVNSNYHANTSSPHQPNEGKPPVRLNAGAATFRHKPTSNFDFRRSVSQRNSPGTNGSSSNESNNNSPNSIVTGGANSTNSAATTPITTTAPATGQQHQQHVTLTGHGQHNGGGVANTPYAVVEPQPASHQATTGAPSLFITSRGTHIPPQLQHHGAGAPGQQQAAAVLGGAAMTALGAYNAGAASGVYFKYGQTYFAHPLPNSRRSPSTADLRPQMAQMTGMYPATMMIQAPPRHAPGRHPNPNYKGTRPR